jgi:Domain of unknown function (DUF4124)
MDKTLLFVCMLGVAFGAMAQQYKWVDKDGKVQYGDTPPPGVKATPLKPPPGPSQAPPAAAKKDTEKALSPEAAFRKRQQEAKEKEEKAGKERADAESKRTNCDAAQATLRQIQSGQRMSTMNAAGERVFIDDEQRARETERAQKSVNEWCK